MLSVICDSFLLKYQSSVKQQHQTESSKCTCSHSSPARGCAGAGNQPERLATSRVVAGFHTISLLEEAEICASGSRPDSRPCRSEHGASGVGERESERAVITLTFAGRGGGV